MPLTWTATATNGAAVGPEQFSFAYPAAGVTTLTLSGATASGDIATISGTTSLKDALGEVVLQSERRCNRFLSDLVLYETGTNTGADVLATVTSTLAAALTPVGTSHALSAASAIITGSKTAIDTDVYAKASIANFASAIDATYYSDMSKYVGGLAAADPSTLSWPIEVYKITAIHRECALATAQATISKTLQPPSAAAPATAAATAANLTVSYTTSSADASSVATGLINAVNNSAAYQAAGVTAAATAPPGSGFILKVPPAMTIAWSYSALSATKNTAAGESLSFQSVPGSTTVSLSGAANGRAGDVITLVGSPSTPTQANGTGASVSGVATTPQAVVPGQQVH